MAITKVGNVTDAVNTKEYKLLIRDKDDTIWTIFAYGIDDITSNPVKVNLETIGEIFENITMEDVQRPPGGIDLLIGVDCCQLFPNVVATKENLQLMNGPLGYCLRGSHELIHEGSERRDTANVIRVKVHSTVIDPKNTEIHVDEGSMEDKLRTFFNIESLGASLLPANCVNCREMAIDDLKINENISI